MDLFILAPSLNEYLVAFRNRGIAQYKILCYNKCRQKHAVPGTRHANTYSVSVIKDAAVLSIERFLLIVDISISLGLTLSRR